MAENSTQTIAAPQVECEKYHAILTVPDVRSAVEFYTTKLGFWLAFAQGDPPTFAGVNLGNVQMFLEHGTACPAGCSDYFVVNDADTLYRFHRSNGVEILDYALIHTCGGVPNATAAIDRSLRRRSQ